MSLIFPHKASNPPPQSGQCGLLSNYYRAGTQKTQLDIVSRKITSELMNDAKYPLFCPINLLIWTQNKQNGFLCNCCHVDTQKMQLSILRMKSTTELTKDAK